MERLKNGFFLALGVILVGWSFYAFLQQPAPTKYQQGTPVVRSGEYDIPVEIADTDAKRQRGLSDRDPLEAGHGLLFVFDAPGEYGFWMKDMAFAIDIVWIAEDWTVIGIEKSAAPESFPHIFYPSAPVKYVLEMNAGDAQAFSIAAGSKLNFSYRK